jgi:hypothetical protein
MRAPAREAARKIKGRGRRTRSNGGRSIGRLGGLHGVGSADMRRRNPEQWIDWLARDRTFSPQPYNELATVLTAAGRRDTAEAILFAGRERERDETWSWLRRMLSRK